MIQDLTVSSVQFSAEIIDCFRDPLFEIDARLPPENFASTGDIGLPHFRVIHRQGLVSILDFVPVIRMIS